MWTLLKCYHFWQFTGLGFIGTIIIFIAKPFTWIPDSSPRQSERRLFPVRMSSVLHQGGSNQGGFAGIQPASRYSASGLPHKERTLHLWKLRWGRQAHTLCKFWVLLLFFFLFYYQAWSSLVKEITSPFNKK